MTREEVVKWLELLKKEIGKAENHTLWHYAESIDMAIKALKALPSTEQKTKCIAQIKIDQDDIEDFVNEKVNEIVEKVAEPRTGRWISNHDGSWDCSECGLHVLIYAKGNYCPNCGAKMGGDSK